MQFLQNKREYNQSLHRAEAILWTKSEKKNKKKNISEKRKEGKHKLAMRCYVLFIFEV